MKCILKPLNNEYAGDLIWMHPYFYPKSELNKGIGYLEKEGYQISLLQSGYGIMFKTDKKKDDIDLLVNFMNAFPWMDFVISRSKKDIALEVEKLNTQLVLLPLSRIEIFNNIHTPEFSIFCPGELDIDKISVPTLIEGSNKFVKDIDKINNINFRNFITYSTQITIEVFKEKPILILRDNISFETYINLNQIEDAELIRNYSNKAESIMDVIKFRFCNYTLPEKLPSRAGQCYNNYTTALVYFPTHGLGFFQAREVELKSIVKGIGLSVDKGAYLEVQSHPLLYKKLNETGKLAKHALRLNSMILESDDNTNKFVQIMTLLEFIGEPDKYGRFKQMKSKLIALIAKNKTEYHRISRRLEEITAGLKDSNDKRTPGIRTSIVHNGERLEEIISSKVDRIKLFKELEGYVRINIEHMIKNCHLTWEQFDNLRKNKRDKLLNNKIN